MDVPLSSSQFLDKNNRTFYLKTRRPSSKNNVTIVREQYLRDDIPCYSPHCHVCPTHQSEYSTIGMLPSEATHYIIPVAGVVGPYLEIFESLSITGIVLLQTVVSSVKESVGSRSYQRLKALVKQERKKSIYFSNELHMQTYVNASAESNWSWCKSLVWTAACWYAKHLTMVDIVVLVDSPEEWECNTTPGNLRVLTLKQYLEEFHSELIAQYMSMKTSLETECREDKHYAPHLSRCTLLEEIAMGRLFSGTLHVNKRRTSVAYVKLNSSAPFEGDVFIEGTLDRNRAIHGDVVAVEIIGKLEGEHDLEVEISEEQKGKVCGKIVGILERRSTEHVVVFPEVEASSSNKATMVLVVPYDVRIPKVRISTHLTEELRSYRILIRVDGWEEGSQYPHGHFVCSLGPIGDVETETKAILITHGLMSQPFTKAQLAELPPEDWSLTDEELSKRRDLRSSHLVFSIDPKGCEDIDDAMSVRVKKNGHLELGVHIADVSHFVSSGSLLDREAASRATTVYLPHRRYDMLPGLLSTDLCSLWSGVDKCAVSVLCELNSSCDVVKVWFGRTVIRSSYKLTYEVAQAIADVDNLDAVTNEIKELDTMDRSAREEKLAELKEAICALMTVTRKLKQKRKELGALDLDTGEVKITVTTTDERVSVEDIAPSSWPPLEIHGTVAECMILANHLVAKRIHQAFPSSALLRAHPSPDPENFTHLQRLAAIKGQHIDISSNKTLEASLARCASDDSFQKIVKMLTVRMMRNAVYFSTGSRHPDQFYHYGLALDFYTHFTSPIRRYADIVVHRMLLAAVGGSPGSFPPGGTAVDTLCSNLNSKTISSKSAQMQSRELFQSLFFGNKQYKMEGVVIELRDCGVTVSVLRYGVQGTVYLKDKQGRVAQPNLSGDGVTFGEGTFEVNDTSVKVSYPGGDYTIALLDHLMLILDVEVSRAHGPSFVFNPTTCGAMRVSEIIDMKQGVQQTALESNVVKTVSKPNRSNQQTLYEVVSTLHKLSLED